MRVIRRNQPPEEKERTLTCYNCQSVLVFKSEDVASGPVRGGELPYHYIICPVCQRQNDSDGASIYHDTTAEDYYNK